ncbi:MAG TPA: SulP family inorganic anion transporter [Frankiaceae bacterium]|jgi:high affinity sulfate transporter 1|nr:SulP family inorganic anion transporter [Frankiaceae bacterium]
MPGSGLDRVKRLHLLSGVLPISRPRLPTELLAGLTLAALGIPEVLGYASIARMPVVTGLYTMLLPMAVFAVIGSSRHLVVAADSATAAIVAAGVAGIAAPGTHRYVQLVSLAALMAGVFLLIARLVRLGFLANFLSRTVLIGFLTGVGISVAIGQLPQLLGVRVTATQTLPKLGSTVRHLGSASLTTVAVSAAVIVVVLVTRRLARRVPGALIAVVAAIVLSQTLDFDRHGIRVLGHVPSGFPAFSAPAFGIHDIGALFATAGSIFLVILAQSSATSRAYAARYDEDLDDDQDLLGLSAANVVAGFSGTFVVNGSPTKTEMVDGSGGRTQLSQLTTCVVVLVVLLVLTGPLGHLPLAVLAAVVFVIGIDLVDLSGLRRLFAVRVGEFALAVLTAIAVIALGVEQGLAAAVIASIVVHLRHSYNPATSVLVKQDRGHWHNAPVTPDQRTVGGLVVYRFPSNPYYANSHRLAEDLRALRDSKVPLDWLCLDCAGIADIDFTAAETLRRMLPKSARFVVSSVWPNVREQLIRYRLLVDPDTDIYPTPGAVLEAYETKWTHQ